mgnify:CR=1 FL=1
MNIKQASEQSGVSAPNIRFYEKEGLLTPARRQGNDYRDYTAGDVRTLKLIRMLRMLDVPLPTIKAVLRGEQPLQQALQAQQTVLEQQAAQLAAAMQFCADLARQQPQADTLDVDACLTRMESPTPQQGFFSGWLQDYCTLARVQHQKHFFFIPQGSINTPQEFTAALQTYAEERGMQFALTKKGMYPEFSLDGIPYKAYRNPGKYRDEICCDAVHPEQLDTGLPSRREKLLRILCARGLRPGVIFSQRPGKLPQSGGSLRQGLPGLQRFQQGLHGPVCRDAPGQRLAAVPDGLPQKAPPVCLPGEKLRKRRPPLKQLCLQRLHEAPQLPQHRPLPPQQPGERLSGQQRAQKQQRRPQQPDHST